MKYYKAYKYRIYPDSKQRVLFAKHFGCVRMIYNWALSQRKTAWEKDKTRISRFDQSKQIKNLRNEKQFLKEVNCQSLHSAIEHVDLAYQNFFRRVKQGDTPGYPQFKSHNTRQSCTFPQYSKLSEKKLYLVKIGWIKIVQHRKFAGKLKTVTISRTSSGKYFASLLSETDVEFIRPPRLEDSQTLALNLNVVNFYVSSDAQKIFSPHFYLRNLKRIRKLSRKVSRRKNGSHRKEKARIALAKLHEKIANQRRYFLDTLSTQLVNNVSYSTFVIQNYDIRSMVEKKRRNIPIAKEILDSGWYIFQQMMKYKCIEKGKNYIEIENNFPATQLCNSCETRNNVKVTKTRKWQCKKCGTVNELDHNAAKNLKDKAMEHFESQDVK